MMACDTAAAFEPEPTEEPAFEPTTEDRVWAVENLDPPASTPEIRVVSRRPWPNTSPIAMFWSRRDAWADPLDRNPSRADHRRPAMPP
jgi:hypothetical protein